jgi:hypothetical protein
LTIDEIAALFGIPVTAVRERLARRAVPQEYFSIPELAKRWRCSRGTMYNRLRAHGGKVLDFVPNGKRGKSRGCFNCVAVRELISKVRG